MDPSSTTKSIFHVTGMSCSSCVAKIEREVSKREGKKCTFEDIDESVGKPAHAHFGTRKLKIILFHGLYVCRVNHFHWKHFEISRILKSLLASRSHGKNNRL